MNSPEQTSILPSYRIMALAAILIASGSVVIGYSVGHRQGMSAVGASAREVSDLQHAVVEQKSAIEILTRTLNAVVQERDIAVTSAKDLQLKINQANDLKQLAETRQTRYQDILLSRGGIELTVHQIDIVPLPERAYEYRIDLMALRPNLRNSKGRLSLTLVNGETIVAVPLSEDQFDFSTFERMTGRWTMPSGFTPAYLDISLSANGQKTVQRYAWENGKVVKDAPATLADVPPLPAANSQ